MVVIVICWILWRLLAITNHVPVSPFLGRCEIRYAYSRPGAMSTTVTGMTLGKIISQKWAQLLITSGIALILGGAVWIAIGALAIGEIPLGPFLLLTLGMMPFLVGLEELSNRRKIERMAVHRR